MTPIFASNRFDWSNAIGLFIVNFGTLDYLVFCLFETRMKPEELAKIRNWHFQDRITLVEALVADGDYSPEQK